MSMLTLNGIAVHVQILEPAHGEGTGRTAVLLHGMGSDSLASWYFTLATPLSEAGLRVVMYDLRGHGRSERPATGYRLDDFVDDLAALLAEVGAYRPVYLLGNSFGGTIAFGYAARYPDRVAGVATIESAPPTEGWIKRVVLRLERATAGVNVHNGSQLRAAREVLSATTLVRDISTSALPGNEQLARIDCPVLCVYGGQSGVAAMAPVVRRLLPQARTVVVPGRRHSLLVDEPEAVRRLVMSWMERQPEVPA